MRRILWTATAVGVALALGACGGGRDAQVHPSGTGPFGDGTGAEPLPGPSTTSTTPPPAPMSPAVPVSVHIVEAGGLRIEVESGLPTEDAYHLAVVEGVRAALDAFDLPAPFRVVVTPDVDHLVARWLDATDNDRPQAEEVMSMSGAVSMPGWLFVNPSRMPDDPAFYFRTVIHEVHHIHQYALATPPGGHPQDGLDRMRPPNWLIEGSAQYVSAQIADRHRAGVAAAYERAMDAALVPFDGDLSRYELEGMWEDDHAYDASAAAVRHLVGLAGVEAVTTDYWADRARGGDWRATFERVFGIGVDAFYDEVRGIDL